jgi:FkbM family methyltransferase
MARLRIRALGGREVVVRPGTSDPATVWGAYARRYHLPPPEIGSPRTIWDLGANIGLTMAHFLYLYPEAKVLGVELDGGNLALARRNVAEWADRCELIHAAVWPTDGEVQYRGWGSGTSNFQVTGGDGVPVPAVSLNTLMAAGDGPVDYLKIDIEGAERPVLREHTDWASEVRSLKVELHGGYSAAECEADLRKLGFRTRVDAHYAACVIGVRSPETRPR